jgi:hypothetical protein
MYYSNQKNSKHEQRENKASYRFYSLCAFCTVHALYRLLENQNPIQILKQQLK